MHLVVPLIQLGLLRTIDALHKSNKNIFTCNLVLGKSLLTFQEWGVTQGREKSRSVLIFYFIFLCCKISERPF